MTGRKGVLYVVVCAAASAVGVGELIAMAQDEGWAVQVVATPSALGFVDVPELEGLTGRPVRSGYRRPDEPKPPRADAIVVAPATYNTVNKFAQGVADTYALGLMAEAPGLGIPVVVVPFVNSALASRLPFRRSVETLRAERVCVLLDEEGPDASGSEDGRTDARPWRAALDEIEARRNAGA
ncbi:flavoprotein [Streptosporangium carneum]|uniref:Flavoprotein n=1 Tax=Streptosporangium carneum TaxID=47481 RepID=A0A9W6I988_9ACTN|nr:flavoprotein [Streptosporangium carneum]GLK13746.1 flavoprotein [Streptosporangium carneum]